MTSERGGLSVEAVADVHSSGLLPERAVLGSTTDRLSGRSRPGGGTVHAIRGQRWQPAADAALSSMGTRRGAGGSTLALGRLSMSGGKLASSGRAPDAPLLVLVAVPMDGRKRRGVLAPGGSGDQLDDAGLEFCQRVRSRVISPRNGEPGGESGRRFLPFVAVPRVLGALRTPVWLGTKAVHSYPCWDRCEQGKPGVVPLSAIGLAGFYRQEGPRVQGATATESKPRFLGAKP